MIKNNKFYINNLRDLIILGEPQRLDCSKHNIKTHVIN